VTAIARVETAVEGAADGAVLGDPTRAATPTSKAVSADKPPIAARTLVPVAVTAPVATAGIPLGAQKLVDLGRQGALEHSPSAVSDPPLEGRSDLVFGLGVD